MIDKIQLMLDQLGKNFIGKEYTYEIDCVGSVYFTTLNFFHNKFDDGLHYVGIEINVDWYKSDYAITDENGESLFHGCLAQAFKKSMVDYLWIERYVDWAIGERLYQFAYNYFRLDPIFTYHIQNLP